MAQDFKVKKFSPLISYRRPKSSRWIFKYLFWAIIIFLLFYLFTYVFPKVRVTLVPETEVVELNLEVTLDKNIKELDLEKNIIPALETIEEKTMEETFKTTSEKEIGEKAQGVVRFINKTGKIVHLEIDTKLMAENNQVYFLTEPYDLPQAHVSEEGEVIFGQIELEVKAREAGEKGNIDSGRIEISKVPENRQDKIYGEIKSAITGGYSELARVVSEEDIKKAKEELTLKLKDELKEKILKKPSSDYKIVEDLTFFEIARERTTKDVNEEAEEFTLEITMKAFALAFKEEDLQKFNQEKLKSKIPKGKYLGDAKNIYKIEVKKYERDNGQALVSLDTEDIVVPEIKFDEIKQQIAGKKEQEARRILLLREEIKDVHFKFKKNIFKRIPNSLDKIETVVQFK